MEWNNELNNAIAMLIVAFVGPFALKKHKEAHETAKRNMGEGWLKWLVTHEFRAGSSKKSRSVRVVGKK